MTDLVAELCKWCEEPVRSFHHQCWLGTLQKRIERLTAERAGFAHIVAELGALLPLSETVGAMKTGATMIAWFKDCVAERDRLRAALEYVAEHNWTVEAARLVDEALAGGAENDVGKLSAVVRGATVPSVNRLQSKEGAAPSPHLPEGKSEGRE